MRRARWTVALAAGLAFAAACGDDGGGGTIDAPDPIDAAIDADIDAPPPLTFTGFVIDLVMTQTANNTDPKPYDTFSTLTDPDQNNPAAYSVLFN